MAKASYSAFLIALLSMSLVFGVFAVQVSGLDSLTLQPTSLSRDFSLVVGPGFIVIPVNGSGLATVSVGSIARSSDTITLSASITPFTSSPPTLSLAPSTVRLKSGQSVNSTLTISTSRQTPFANYIITVLAQGSKVSHSARLNVLVSPPPDFNLTLQPSSETVGLGVVRSSFYTLTSFFGFKGAISITPSNIPIGVGVGLQTPPPLTPGASFTGGLSIVVDSNAILGSYGIVFTGQSGSTIHTAILSLTISSAPPPDFSLMTTPSFLSIPQGSTGLIFVSVSSVGGFNGTVSLTSGVIPVISGGPTTILNQSSVILSARSSHGVELRIITTATTATGFYNYTVTGTSGSLTHTAVGSFTVTSNSPADFSLTLQPSAETVPLGTVRSSFYTLVSISGFSGTVTITPSNIPSGVGIAIQAPQPLTPGTNFTGGLSVVVDTNAVPGQYGIIFTGQSGSTIHTAILSVTISAAPPPDFSLTTTPSFLNIPQGSTGLVIVTLSSISGFKGTVSLTSGIIPVVSRGPTTVLNMTSVNLGAGSSHAVELRIVTTTTTATGFYNFTVTGTSGSLTHTAVGSFAVTGSSPADFSISAIPTSLTILQGSFSRVFLNLTSLNGFGGTIDLAAAVSPTGPRLVLGSSAVSLTPGGMTEVVLAVFVNATVPPPAGNYLITVTGTSGGLSHSVNIQLTVTSSSASLVLVSYSFQPTNVTLQLHNQGGGQITLTYYQVLDGSNNNWTRIGWPGPTLGPNTTAPAIITIGASCPSCTYRGPPGAFNQFIPGNTYLITVVGNGQGFTFSLRYSTAVEGLSLEGSFFFTGTNVTLFLRNIGNVSISLVSYYVKDAAGDQYALTTWPGPTIAPGALSAPEILIGTNCPSCTLTGSPFTFTPGQTYTILLVTTRNNQFSFTVTR